MIVSNLLFDGLLFGALLLALLLDTFVLTFPGLYSLPGVPVFHGAITLIVVGGATYLAAEDFCGALARRKLWTQESLATAFALCAQGFIYYRWRNDSDTMAVVLHIGLMMASLMILIAVVAAVGAAWHARSGAPILGLLSTGGGALLLGVLAGVLTLFLTSNISLPIKIALLIAGVIAWKVRESLKPPSAAGELSAAPVPKTTHATPYGGGSHSPEHPGARRVLAPQRGTLLDRFLPVLIFGAFAFVVLQNSGLARN